jgi:hypothetical protein
MDESLGGAVFIGRIAGMLTLFAERRRRFVPAALGRQLLLSSSLSLYGVGVANSDLKEQLAKLKQGDHICLIYETTAEQLAAVITFIIEGLARGEHRAAR